MKNRQTGSARCIWILGCVRLLFEEDRTLIGRVNTSKNLDQRRFTRAVLAGEANDLSLTDEKDTSDKACTGPNRLLTFSMRSRSADMSRVGILREQRRQGTVLPRQFVLKGRG